MASSSPPSAPNTFCECTRRPIRAARLFRALHCGRTCFGPRGVPPTVQPTTHFPALFRGGQIPAYRPHRPGTRHVIVKCDRATDTQSRTHARTRQPLALRPNTIRSSENRWAQAWRGVNRKRSLVRSAPFRPPAVRLLLGFVLFTVLSVHTTTHTL